MVNDTLAVDSAVNGCATTEYVPGAQFGVHVTAATPLASVIANRDESVHVAPA